MDDAHRYLVFEKTIESPVSDKNRGISLCEPFK